MTVTGLALRHPKDAAHALPFVFSLLLTLAGCAGQPASDVDGRAAPREDTEVAQLARALEARYGLVADARLVAYVEAVGGRVAAHAERRDVRYRFRVVDMAEPNAFALPNGNIYVSRGLLVLINREDQLAAVLAHEVAHVEKRHAQKSSQVGIATAPIRLGTGIAGAAASIVAPRAGQAIAGIGTAATAAVLAPYGRDQEREADAVGQRLLARAGYDPRGLSEFLDTLVRLERLEPQQQRAQSWFSTHPAAAERVSATSATAAGLAPSPRQGVARDRVEVLERLNGLVVGPDPARGVFEDNTFIHPHLDFAVRFPEGWNTVNTPGLVAAEAPDGEALVAVLPVAEGDDPTAGARVVSENLEADLVSGAQRTQVNGLPAAVTQARAGRGQSRVVDFTWIAHRGLVYQIMGLAPTRTYSMIGPKYLQTVQSFRKLGAAERSRIKITRLRVIPADAGETLGALAARANSAWPVERLAIVNGRNVDDPLGPQEPLKVAVPEAYGFDD